MSPDPSNNSKSNDLDSNDLSSPSQFINGFSSDEDLENNQNGQDGYQLLSDEPPQVDVDTSLVDNEELNYNSLSNIMSALETHGPTVIGEEECAQAIEQYQEVQQNNQQLPVSFQDLVIQTDTQRLMDSRVEAAAIWNTPQTSIGIVIDKEKEEEIKTAMSNFTLPASAIPPWAHNLTDDEWKQKMDIGSLLKSVKKVSN